MGSSGARTKARDSLTRRQFLASAGLAAAGGSLLPLLTPSQVRIARAQPSAKSGGSVIVAYLARARSLDPNVWTGYSDNMVMRQIYDPLIWSTKLGVYTPGLATSWTTSKDGRTYTFMLRREVKFHDGTPFDAEAVKFTFDRIADPVTRSLQGPAIGPYDRAEVLSAGTVAIHLKEPFAPFLNNISGTALSPVSPTAAKRLGSNYAQSPVGTGPFMFEKWDGNDLYLSRNPNYNWPPTFMNHRGPAYLDSLVFKTIPEEATRMIALQRGEATAVYFPVLDQVAQYRTNKNYQVFQFTTPGHPQSIPMNIRLAPTDDLRVRQAILYAVDRKKVVDLVEYGNANVANGPFSRTTPFYDAAIEQYYPFDKKRAGELLDTAGWKTGSGGVRQKGGQPLRIQFIMFDSGPLKRESEVIQAMLTDVGFDVALDVTGYDAFAKRVTDGSYNLSEIVYVGLDPNVPAFLMYHSSQITGGGQFNRTRIADPKVDAMIDEGLKTTDLRRRKEAYTAIQEYVMKNALLLPTWENSLLTIAKKEMQGMSFDLEGRWLFYNVSMQR
jgi:peptide/nickel transport system substrate-binding protein